MHDLHALLRRASLREALAKYLDPLAYRHGDRDHYGPTGEIYANARLRVALKNADTLIDGPLASLIAERDAASPSPQQPTEPKQ